ncbi:hypothetical protein CPB84DRAFT_1780041 [Gymnopilus junonius]|uniref:MYND-type domain-containing protein n=1 Tax=Gymnopilus junonius TaxID=109634 RepID=A0A9P5NNP1_GYMJU|nr:hypothetical protein CPB84DRAFT_1780041 [Gymnopilus junonius]
MPGPGKRGKPKSKSGKSSSSSTSKPQVRTDEVYITDVDNAEEWQVIIDILSEIFGLPDLTTRGGLKKVHANFNTICTKIEKTYQKYSDNFKVRGAIVGIFAKMCVDSLLRNRLFEKGILEMILPLLHVDETRHLALRALSTITHHGGAKVRTAIAQHANVLTKLIRDLPDDDKVAELAIITIAHSITAVVEGTPKGPSNPTALKSIDMVDVLKTTLEATKRPYARPRLILDHAVEVLVCSAMHASSSFQAYPSSINFLVAGLRSKDWVTRCSCLGGLVRLYHMECEDDTRQLDPQRLMFAIQRGAPENLQDVMMDYGLMRCDIYITLKCSGDYQKAMMQVAQDHDLYGLGLKLGDLILRTEFSIADGMFEVEDPVTGRHSVEDFGLPFKLWGDALPHCAKAIRRRNKPGEEQDMADILDIKFMIMRQRISDAVAFAKKSIQRSPEQAYFYYAITLSADGVQGLRAAKKGLKCKLTTPFVKYQMMQRAVTHAADMGTRLLQEMPEVGDKKWEEGIAFLTSALEDARSYLDGAPPDNRYMKNVGYWYVLLSMLIREDLSPDLQELKDNLEKLKIAEQFSHFIGTPPPNTELRLAEQAAVKHFPGAIKEFSRVFEELDKVKGKGTLMPDRDKLDDGLAAWLEDMKLEDGTSEGPTSCESSRRGRPTVNFEDIWLYRCSWCGNPSAVLRKCSGCAKTRYCDSACQKSHWTEHKKACKEFIASSH